MKVQKFKRGQIWWYSDSTNYDGHVQGGTRPIIIISNDIANEKEQVLIGIPCTTAEKLPIPCNTTFVMNGITNTALGTNIRSINPIRLTEYIGMCDEELMSRIDECIKISLGLVEFPIKPEIAISNETINYIANKTFDNISDKLSITSNEEDIIEPIFADDSPLEEKLSTRKAYEGVGRKGYQKYTREDMLRFINDCENHTIEWVTKKYNCSSEKATSNKLYRFRKFLKENP
jgi:mRNA interferase MazF